MGITRLCAFIVIGFLTKKPGYGLVQNDSFDYVEETHNKREFNPSKDKLVFDNSSNVALHHNDQTKAKNIYPSKIGDEPVEVHFRKSVSQEQGSVEVYSDYIELPMHTETMVDNPGCFLPIVTMLICRTIPTQISPNVTTLNVTDQDTTFPASPFMDPSFANLSVLFWNGRELNKFSESSFDGLENLDNLTISGMDALDGSSLQQAISSTGVLPKLKYFALDPGETFKWPFLKVETTFLEKLANNRLNSLNLINVISAVKIRDLSVFARDSNLIVLNFTGSFLMIDYSRHPLSLHVPIVKVLDASHVRTANVTDLNSQSSVQTYMGANTAQCNITHPIHPLFLLVEVLFAKSIYSGEVNIRGFCNLSTNVVLLRKVVFSGNNILFLNLTLLLSHNNNINYLDISDNKMKYIGPGFFSTGFAIEQLYLSGNRLNHMEHSQEFENLLSTLVRLEIFDLASNNISFIPPKMFRSNKRLNTLILKNNRLTSISFELGHLKELFELDLRDNAIATMDYTTLNVLFHTRKENISILFAGNPIQCLCESVDFIRWLVTLHEVSKENIYCNYKGDNITVDKGAIDKCVYLCNRTLIVAVSIVCSIVTVALILSTTVISRHFRLRKRKKNVEWRLRQLIEDGNFVCFMAVSGNDETLVNRVILENLQRLLKAKVGLERNLVCTGTRFKPGFPICEEAYRLMKKSQVFVAVVSESFMRSQYCKLELQEACKQNKPMILIFLGHVETEDMPQYMQEVFRRNSRAWIKQNDEGYYYVVPSLIDLTDAIWDLAIGDLLHGT